MNSDIADVAKWAVANGYGVEDDSKGYTRFYEPNGTFVYSYPATPSRPARRMQDLVVALKKTGLQIPPPSKKEQRAQRRRENQ